MIRTLIFFYLCCVYVCGCAAQLNTTPHLSDKHPTELVGTWKAEGSKKDGLWFKKQYSNGKKIVVGLYDNTIFAYEAEWWVKNNSVYEKITNSLFNDLLAPEIGTINESKLQILNFNKHISKDCTGNVLMVYNRTSGKSFVDKYQRIDLQMRDIQANLPDYGGDDDQWVMLSAVRDNDTITYIFREKDPDVPKSNIRNNKAYLIETIRKHPDLMADRMSFKAIYLFSDEKMIILNIKPEEYALE